MANTPVTTVPELDTYSVAPVQSSIESTVSEEIRPLSQLNTGGHVEFIVTSGYNEFVRLDETTLYVRFKVLLSRSDNRTVAGEDWRKVSFVNNILHSLWSQIDLAIGDAQTNISLQTYPIKCYFETLLESTEYSRKTQLQSVGFFADDMLTKDSPQTNRMKYITHSGVGTDFTSGKIYELEGKLHLDLFFQPRALLGGTKMRIKLVPNRPEFYFMTSDNKINPKIEFQDIHLNVVKSKVNDELLAGYYSALNVSPAKYPITRKEVRSITIDKGVVSRNLENVINGQLPRRVYIAFVSNEAFGGSYSKNPFFFHHYNVSSLACYINGEQHPRRAYTPDFDNDLYLREYLELFRTAGQLNNNARMMIDRDSYKNGYSIFAFNLSPDLSQGYNESGYSNIPKNGILRIELHFAKQLDTTINALVFCEFDNLVCIPEDRNAFMDYR